MKELHLRAADVFFLIVLALFIGVAFVPDIPCALVGITAFDFSF